MKKIVLMLLVSSVVVSVVAKPPKPPKGYRWVLNTQFSDEFNGSELDQSKWMNQFNGGWKGRSPAWFNPDAVWVEDGQLKIRSGVLDRPKGNGKYTMYGGAVSSKTKEAHYGYYECKAKASKIAMSTTFWMSNDKVPFTGNDACETDSYSQELDIQEAVGGSTKFDKFKNGMNCNTHYRYVKCGEKKETFISKGTGHILDSPVYEDYHIYGAWWKDANEVMFYADDELFDTVQVRTDISQKPFDRPMQINMVTETYDWQPAPSAEDLENMDINTALYDWVRSYQLVPVDEKVKHKHHVQLYKSDFDAGLNKMQGNVNLEFDYQLNEDCELMIYLRDKKGNVVSKRNVHLLKGYGYNEIALEIPSKAKKIDLEVKSKRSTRVNIKKSLGL